MADVDGLIPELSKSRRQDGSSGTEGDEEKPVFGKGAGFGDHSIEVGERIDWKRIDAIDGTDVVEELRHERHSRSLFQ